MSVTVATVDDLEAAVARLQREPVVPKLALTVPEAMKATGAGKDTIRRWIAEGHLPRVPHTDRVLIPTVALEAFVLAGASTPAAPPAAGVDGPAGAIAADLSGSTAPPLQLAARPLAGEKAGPPPSGTAA